MRDWDPAYPETWPLWVRRVFIATIPISGPLYLAIMGITLVLGVALALVFFCAIKPFIGACKGVGQSYVDAIAFCRKMWSARP